MNEKKTTAPTRKPEETEFIVVLWFVLCLSLVLRLLFVGGEAPLFGVIHVVDVQPRAGSRIGPKLLDLMNFKRTWLPSTNG